MHVTKGRLSRETKAIVILVLTLSLINISGISSTSRAASGGGEGTAYCACWVSSGPCNYPWGWCCASLQCDTESEYYVGYSSGSCDDEPGYCLYFDGYEFWPSWLPCQEYGCHQCSYWVEY